MEQIIKLLPEHISNQIAAGEVIQRPASVVKELVENAIDAGATSVDVVIKDAGKTLIQVIDNGKGISIADTKMAFERHATSKIKNVKDLFDLHTKGFRGEALASIAAIAHVTLTTKQKQDEVGTLVVNEGGEIKKQDPIVCKDGTSFEVKNLFFNVPARRNFLKSDNVEFGHIEEEFLRVALIHFNLDFSLTHNEKVIYQLKATNQRRRIVDVFGKSYNDKLVPVHTETNFATIDGFIGKPEFAKRNRDQQYLFVNNRFFKDTYFNHAISTAFSGLVAEKTYPAYFLSFEIDPARIDVNVHPTKTEIKFEYQKEIYAILKSAVKEALGKFNIFPTLDFDRETAFDLPYDTKYKEVVSPQIPFNPEYNPFNTTSHSGTKSTKKDSDYANKSLQAFGFERNRETDPNEWKNFYQIEEQKETQTRILSDEEIDFEKCLQQLSILRELAFVPVENQLWVVHLGRANERIVYNQLFDTFLIAEVSAQPLLFPIETEITPSELTIWKENEKTLHRMGFDWDLKKNILKMAAVPTIIPNDLISATIENVRNLLAESHFDKSELASLLIQTIAVTTTHANLWTIETAKMTLESWYETNERQLTPTGNKIVKIWNPLDLLK